MRGQPFIHLGEKVFQAEGRAVKHPLVGRTLIETTANMFVGDKTPGYFHFVFYLLHHSSQKINQIPLQVHLIIYGGNIPGNVSLQSV